MALKQGYGATVDGRKYRTVDSWRRGEAWRIGSFTGEYINAERAENWAVEGDYLCR